MVTQELIAYIRSELNKGRSREQIRTTLLSGGGWSDMDISEVFRDIMPFGKAEVSVDKVKKEVLKPDPTPQPKVSPPVVTITPTPIKTNPAPSPVSVFHVSQKKKPHVHMLCSFKIEKSILFAKRLRYVLFVVLFVLLGVLGYMLRNNLSSLPRVNMSVFSNLISKINLPKKTETAVEVPQIPVVSAPVEIQTPVDCGVTTSPDLDNKEMYLKDNVLKCIGENADICHRAYATINSTLFPTNLEIKKDGDMCLVSIMYSSSSSLVDVFGKKLALRDVSCPVSVIKNLNKTPQNVSFVNPKKENLYQYGFDIYFYLTLGLFIDNNFDNNKITGLGCSGEYIKSVIDSHNLNK